MPSTCIFIQQMCLSSTVYKAQPVGLVYVLDVLMTACVLLEITLLVTQTYSNIMEVYILY